MLFLSFDVSFNLSFVLITYLFELRTCSLLPKSYASCPYGPFPLLAALAPTMLFAICEETENFFELLILLSSPLATFILIGAFLFYVKIDCDPKLSLPCSAVLLAKDEDSFLSVGCITLFLVYDCLI